MFEQSDVRAPGRPHEAERRRTGVPYSTDEVAALRDEALRAGVAPLEVSTHPLGS
jgi:hypothetical protein